MHGMEMLGKADGVLNMKIAVYTDDEKFYDIVVTVLENLGGNSDISFGCRRVFNLKQTTELLAGAALNMALIDLETPMGKEAAEFLYLNDSGCSCYLLDKDETQGLFGYQVGARDFLLKPVENNRLLKIVSDEARRHQTDSLREIKIRIDGLWRAVPPSSILYVESMGHNLTFHMVDGRKVRFVATFKEYYPVLNTFPRFLRCHQSYIINLDYAEDMKSDVFRMASGEEINISRQYRKESKKYFIDYMLKKYYESPEKKQ